MKIAIVNYSDIAGGAALASYRLHKALLKAGIDSIMYVNEMSLIDPSIIGPKSKLKKFINKRRVWLGYQFNRLFKTKNSITHTVAVLPSNWPNYFNNSDFDIIHLNWVGGEMMSISDIGAFSKPILWTLHDMWAFCGAEHITWDERYISGYKKENRPTTESGIDINKWVWNRKIDSWKKPIQIVAPSHWMGECVSNSKLMGDWPLDIIPNGLDIDEWKPIDSLVARKKLQLPDNCEFITFGSMGANSAKHKGFDLLQEALSHLKGQIPNLHILIFGEGENERSLDLGFQIHYLGKISDQEKLQLIYSASTAMIIPSRIDNLPNTGLESMACGTPIVAFDICGLKDMVTHKSTGYLCKAFDTEDMAAGIKWIVTNPSVSLRLGFASRVKAEKMFSSTVLAKNYIKLYKNIIQQSQ